MAAFDSLAPEIHVMFMLLVDSIDVIALRQVCSTGLTQTLKLCRLTGFQTCKALYAPSFERSVWFKFACETHVEQNLFIPACTLSAMTASELERVVCGHHMWNALTAKNPRNDKVLEPLSRYRLTMPRSQLRKDKSMLSSCGVTLRLVPGGNFLVGVSTVALCIWKIRTLHIRQGSHPPLQPISTIRLNIKSEGYYSSFHDMLVARTPDGDGLRVALQYCNLWATRSVMHSGMY